MGPLHQSSRASSGGIPDSSMYACHCSPSRSNNWLASSGENDTRETTIPCCPCGPMRMKSSVNSCGVRAMAAALAHLPANSSEDIMMFGPWSAGPCSDSSGVSGSGTWHSQRSAMPCVTYDTYGRRTTPIASPGDAQPPAHYAVENALLRRSSTWVAGRSVEQRDAQLYDRALTLSVTAGRSAEHAARRLLTRTSGPASASSYIDASW